MPPIRYEWALDEPSYLLLYLSALSGETGRQKENTTYLFADSGRLLGDLSSLLPDSGHLFYQTSRQKEDRGRLGEDSSLLRGD